MSHRAKLRLPVAGRGQSAAAAIAALLAVSCPVLERSRPASDRGARAPSAATEKPARPLSGSGADTLAGARPAGDELVSGPEAQGEWPTPTEDELAALGRHDAAEPERALAAIAKETFVFEEPGWGSKKIGYLRGGSVVTRALEPAGRAACKDGWYRIAPAGYVCVGKAATLDLEHPVFVAARHRADAQAPLPYRYGLARFPTPPFYTKVPSTPEQARVEPELAKHRAALLRRDAWQATAVEPIPDFLDAGRPAPTLNGHFHSVGSVHTGRAMVKSGFAFLRVFDADGRKFGLSVDLDVMPLDRLEPVVASAFKGLELDETTTLPVAFVRRKGAALYAGEPRGKGLAVARLLEHREALPLSGRQERVGANTYVEVKGGEWLLEPELVIVPPMQKRPGWATPGRTWIDVSILRQTLVAYEGARPVYVTLISSGADGLGDPEKTHSTVRGQFLIHTKHLTATMSGDEVGDEFDLRDVPYVQYFTEGYALHAAYWHDSFGRPRSHGCINLSPADALWLFHWTDPPLPEGWHGVMSLREGTLIHIHP